MPSSLAMATAVSLWSPVIITGRMPAAAALLDGGLDLRTHRVDHARQPQKAQILLQIRPGSLSWAGASSQSRCSRGQHPQRLVRHGLVAAPGSPAACPPSWAALCRSPHSGCSGAAPRPGAPLVYWTKPLPHACARWTSSSGRSQRELPPARGCSCSSRFLSSPTVPRRSSPAPHSVGSPCDLCRPVRPALRRCTGP